MVSTATASSGGPPVDPRLLRHARTARGFFALSGVIAFAQTLSILGFAWLLATAITDVVAGRADRIGTTLAWLGVVIAVRAALVWANDRVSAGAAARVGSELRTATVDAIRRLGPGWLAGRNSAALTVTAGHGLDALDAYFGRFLPQLVATIIATPVIVLVMWWQDWQSGLAVVLTLPLIPIFMVLIGLATRSVQNRQWDTLRTLAVRFSDTVAGLGTLRVFGRDHRAASRIEAVSDTYRSQTMKVLRVTFLSGFMLEFLASIAVAIVAVSIGFRLLGGEMTLFAGLFVLLLAPEAFLPLRNVGVQFHAATEGLTATRDVLDIIDAAASAPERVPSRNVVRGSLDLSDVRVRYGERVLRPVSFTADAGTVTLIDGASGAGKSSLFAALRGVAAFDGTACVSGQDVRVLSPAAWLAWSGQRPGLIAGSVADNVALGDEVDGDTVRWALDAAGAADISATASLGVRGAGLSGGQAQRVAVARALYRWRRGNASVIALDEPSSALDADTESALWRSLRAVADAGATVLLISHRRTARDIADTVVTIEPTAVQV